MTVHVDNNPEVGYLTRRERHGQGCVRAFKARS